MDDDTSVFPPNHPLRVYLRDLSLDDIDEVDPYETSPDYSSLKNDESPKLSRNYNFISETYHAIDSFPKRLLLERLIKSGYVLSDDRAHLQMCKKELDNLSYRIPYYGILCTAPIFLASLLTNSTTVLFASGALTCVLFSFNFLFTITNAVLVKYAVGKMEELFATFVRSVRFLRELVGVEMGLIFAGPISIGQTQLNRIVLPNFTAKLFDAVHVYALDMLSISQNINSIIESSDILSSRLKEIGDYFIDHRNNPTDALFQEKNLRGIKVLLEAAFELNSEVVRVFGCFFALHFSELIPLALKMFRLVGLWILSLWRAKRGLRSVELMQMNLLKGKISSDEPIQSFPESSISSVGQANVRKMLSALSSLHYNVLAWSLRINNLREKVITNSTKASLPDFVTTDLEPMHLLLANCQQHLDEAVAVLRSESNEPLPSQSSRFEFSSPVPEEVSDNLIPLDSEQPPIEDECLEAVAGDDNDLRLKELDEFYDGFDQSYRPFTKAEIKKRNAERAVLLIELNSVIAHRMVETRQREEKALLRARRSMESTRSQPPHPVSQETLTIKKIACADAEKEKQVSIPRPNLKQRMLLRSRNFSLLVKPLEPILSNTDANTSPHVLGDVRDPVFSKVPSRLPSISKDLKELITKRNQVVPLSIAADEEIFNDIGTGEALDDPKDNEDENKCASK